jgi:hypothetical protein
MRIDYELLKIYGKNDNNVQEASIEMQNHIDSNYFEVSEIKELCKRLDVVIFYEESQDDGNSECILVNNKGRLISAEKCSLDNIIETRKKVKSNKLSDIFTKAEVKLLEANLIEFELSMEEFIEDNIDEFLYDLYENKKNTVIENISKYYK